MIENRMTHKDIDRARRMLDLLLTDWDLYRGTYNRKSSFWDDEVLSIARVLQGSGITDKHRRTKRTPSLPRGKRGKITLL